MKKLFPFATVLVILIACNNSKKEKDIPKDTRIMLRTDTINVVKMTDTMIIYESTCRGCAYENTTDFTVKDSLGIVQLDKVYTMDNNPDDVAGGSIRKDLVLLPLKPGLTTITVTKRWTHEDSASVNGLAPMINTYTIDVRN